MNLKATKPGVNTMFLIFSTRTADRIWELPLYRHFQAELDALLEATIGRDAMSNIVRLQLAQMTAGAHIKPHRDAGPWAKMCVTDSGACRAACKRCMHTHDQHWGNLYALCVSAFEIHGRACF